MTPKPAVGSAWARVPPARPRLLVVDDDPGLVAVVAEWLGGMADVYTATTSAHALALAAVVPPHVAIVDIVLPRMDGFLLVQRLRREPGLRKLPVVFITGSDRLDVVARADELGSATLLYKPLQEDSLQTAVVTLLRSATSV